MVLAGTEVKSIREGKVNFVDSFCVFFKGELWVRNMHIAEYRFGTTNNHLAVHDRKLLLHKGSCASWKINSRKRAIPSFLYGYSSMKKGMPSWKSVLERVKNYTINGKRSNSAIPKRK